MSKSSPEFGDVFRVAVGAPDDCYLFLRPSTDGEWIGLRLDAAHTERLVGFDRHVWEFVEHIDGEATGGWLTREMLEEAMRDGPGKISLSAGRSAGKTRAIAETIARLKAEGKTDIKVVGDHAVSYSEP